MGSAGGGGDPGRPQPDSGEVSVGGDSVLYVSFGSTTSMTYEQIKELAFGLEQSEQKFIWVFRHAGEGSIFSEDVKRDELPEGYEERMKEVGMVVRDWAPQLQILGQPSTGGFMSHLQILGFMLGEYFHGSAYSYLAYEL
ncbi:unnamed protein product [Camellia sinensis]